MSEIFYRDSEYTSFAPRKNPIARPVFTEYQKHLDAPDPSFGETFSAHLGYQWMPVTNFIQEQITFTDQEKDPDFRWQDQDETDSYYQFMNELSRAKNREHYDFIMSGIDQGIKRRETMDRGGLFPALVAGIADPLNIAFAMPVFNMGVKAAWATGSVFGVAKESAKVGFGFGIASESIRAPFDPMNTPHEVAMNIGASTVMTSLLGGGMKGIANTYSGMKLKKLNKEMADLKEKGEFVGPEPFTPATPEVKPVTPETKTTTTKEQIVDPAIERRTISEMSDEQLEMTYGREFNVKKIVRDPKTVDDLKAKHDKKNVLGSHIHSDEGGTIFVDVKRTKEKFLRLKEKAKDKLKGYAELEKLRATGKYTDAAYQHSKFAFGNIDRFRDENEFVDFVIFHELMHGKFPKLADETNLAYEMRINTLALNRAQTERLKTSTKTGAIKETIYSRIGFVSKFIPSRIINEAKDLSVIIKDDYNKMSFNASVALEGNQYGKASQSLSARAKLHGGKAYALRIRMREKYMKFMKSRVGTGEFMGFDVASISVRANRYMRGDTTQKTYDEWFDDLVMTHIDNGNPEWHAANYKMLPETIKEALDDLDALFRSIDEQAREVGVLGDDVGIRNQLKQIANDIENSELELPKLRASIKSVMYNATDRAMRSGSKSDKPQLTVKQAKYISSLEADIAIAEKRIKNGKLNTIWLNGVLNSPTRKNYKFPIYYDKATLLQSAEKREALTKVFADHFLEEGTYKKWDGDKWIDVEIRGKADKARAEAEAVVNKILEIGDNLHENGVGMGKGKHLMIRATNIPEWKVKDFIIRDDRVIENYLDKMGFRIEWARTFGRQSIDDLLETHTIIMKSDGLSDKRIAQIRTNFLADYERESGQMIRSADRWDNKYSRLTKKVAGMTYLTGAGVTSIIETVAMPIFEHGYGRVFRTAVQAVDGNWDNIKANVKNLRYVNEGMEMAKSIAQKQFLVDSARDMQPGRLERAVEAMEKGFYIGNGLSIITKIGKEIDMAIRIPKFYEQINNLKNNIKSAAKDEEELNRYGITRDVAVRISNMPWEKTESGMPVLNLAEWPEATALDRELKRTMMTYLASASRNTIMHATAFDRPMIMDGFVYVKHKPWMNRLGITVDERASIKVGKNITYPMARVESGVMAFPFQFYNFAFAATNRIAASMLDPSRQHRMAGLSALMAMSYITLLIKKPDWWFENKDMPELMMRSFEMSGITGIYSDLAYQALHSAIATGLHNPDDSWLKGKYKPTVGDQFADFAGATPGMMREWVLGAHELLTDQSAEGLKRFSYNLPIIGLTPFAEDMRELSRSITRQ